MTEIKLYKTPGKSIKIIVLAIPFIIIGVWTIKKHNSSSLEQIIAWIGTCFFGLGIPVGLFNMFDRRPQIILNENTIWDRTTKQDKIKWEQISEAYPININGQKFISLVVDDSFVFKKKQYKWAAKLSEAFGVQKLNLQVSQIKINEKEFADFINKMSKTTNKDRPALIKIYFDK